MRRTIVYSLLALTVPCTWAQNTPSKSTPYYVVFLRPDPARKPLPAEQAARIQAAHMANIQQMALDGVLVSAGPFEDTPANISGIFIIKADSLESARAIALKDPTVAVHR